MKRIQDSYVVDTQDVESSVLSEYMNFYISHPEVSHCFRTLYRIYDFIDRARLSDDIKGEYLKIIRAQLSEGELFFLRYNAMSFYGSNFVTYVNKYHVLKHVPIFDLLEFKQYWGNLKPEERVGMNVLFATSTRVIQAISKKGTYPFRHRTINSSKEKFELMLNYNSASNLEILIFKNNNYPNSYYELAALERFSRNQIYELMVLYLKELFLYSNFCKYNDANNLTFYRTQFKSKLKPYVSVGVRTNDGRKLKMCYKDIEEEL